MMSDTTLKRTPDEIVTRITEVNDDDVFGFRCEVLIYALDYARAKPYLSDMVTEESWKTELRGMGDTKTAAHDYLSFAIGKILDHRGMSANRSVYKLGEYAWLLGRDDVVAAMDDAEYTQYGAPKVKAFAIGMGFEWPDINTLRRMASGYPCVIGCSIGCGI